MARQSTSMPPGTSIRLRKTLKIAGTLLSSGLFIWLLARQDWLLIVSHLRKLPVWLWPVCLALVVSGMLCNAWRWYILLRAQSVPMPLPDIIKTIFAGAFASNFLPSTIGGDAFRILSVMRFTSSRTLGVASVVVDRALNVLAMLSFLPFAWLSFGAPFPSPTTWKEGLPVAASGAFTTRVGSFIQRIIYRLKEAFSAWLRRPGSLLAGLLVSWLSILVVFVAVWLIARGLGMQVALYHVMGVSVITYLVMLLPVSFNGYGLREVTVTALYVALGSSMEQASTLALVTRAFMLFETLPGALWLSQILPGGPVHSLTDVNGPGKETNADSAREQ